MKNINKNMNNIYENDIINLCTHLNNLFSSIINGLLKNQVNNDIVYNELYAELYEILKLYTNETNKHTIIKLLDIENFINNEIEIFNNIPILFNNIHISNNNIEISNNNLINNRNRYITEIILTFCIYYSLSQLDKQTFDRELYNDFLLSHIIKIKKYDLKNYKPYTKFTQKNCAKIFNYLNKIEHELMTDEQIITLDLFKCKFMPAYSNCNIL